MRRKEKTVTNKDIDIIVLYTTSLCNLACNYCYIDKNEALIKIDKILEESFNDENYYINFIKEICEDPNQLRQLQFWGGEPSLHLERTYHIIEQVIKNYPSFDTIMFSTNFTLVDFFDKVQDIFNIYSKYPYRKFILDIQLSIDGPPAINDLGRGANTSKLFQKNIERLIEHLNNKEWIPKNVSLYMHFKPTLSMETIPLLQTEERVFEYFSFFDELTYEISKYKSNQFSFYPTLPNTAEPSNPSKEMGQMFANLCKHCYNIEKKHKFKSYCTIMPYRHKGIETVTNRNFNSSCKSCGLGKVILGLLPEHKVSLCHMGFVDLIEDYKKICLNATEDKVIDLKLFNNLPDYKGFKTNCTLEEFYQQKKQLLEFDCDESTFQIANLIAQIQLYAKYNIIDQKYTDNKEALEAARFILTLPICLRDSTNVTGSMALMPSGKIRLLLNGAKEYILNEI